MKAFGCLRAHEEWNAEQGRRVGSSGLNDQVAHERLHVHRRSIVGRCHKRRDPQMIYLTGDTPTIA